MRGDRGAACAEDELNGKALGLFGSFPTEAVCGRCCCGGRFAAALVLGLEDACINAGNGFGFSPAAGRAETGREVNAP